MENCHSSTASGWRRFWIGLVGRFRKRSRCHSLWTSAYDRVLDLYRSLASWSDHQITTSFHLVRVGFWILDCFGCHRLRMRSWNCGRARSMRKFRCGLNTKMPNCMHLYTNHGDGVWFISVCFRKQLPKVSPCTAWKFLRFIGEPMSRSLLIAPPFNSVTRPFTKSRTKWHPKLLYFPLLFFVCMCSVTCGSMNMSGRILCRVLSSPWLTLLISCVFAKTLIVRDCAETVIHPARKMGLIGSVRHLGIQLAYVGWSQDRPAESGCFVRLLQGSWVQFCQSACVVRHLWGLLWA